MPRPLRIVVGGGVAAGPEAAARARRLDPDAEITIVEKNEVLSYYYNATFATACPGV